MDRQLKERLVGAAVLVAIAVIMVPEMFSGSGRTNADRDVSSGVDSSTTSTTSLASTSQIKTYHIELQKRDHTAEVAPVAAESSSAMSSAASLTITSSSSSSLSVVNVSSSTSVPSTTPVVLSVASSSRSVTGTGSTENHPGKGNWTVQIGSFGADARAREIAANVKGQGYAAYWSPIKVGSKTLFRVRVGPFVDQSAAEVALARLKHSYPEASVVSPEH